MKLLILHISILLTFVNLDIISVREAYRDAVYSKEKSFILYDKLQAVSKADNTILIAYKGAVTTLTSKYLKGAEPKKERLIKGVDLLEFAVEKDPENIEIRFIRLSIQQNIPKFLKYNKHIEEDKALVLSNFKKINTPELKVQIREYILQSKHFSSIEKTVISQP